MLSQYKFIENYAKRSNLTIQELTAMGLIAVPCECGEEGCEGWAMIRRCNMKDHFELYYILKE